jgi:hypothetical protein
MRALARAVFFLTVVLFPTVSSAQAYSFPTPPPQVTAASAPWQLGGEPVFFAGSFYYPAGPTVFFDGHVMVRSGTYNGVPLYTDTTLIPWGIVFVPIGGGVMRPYERRREGELAGTTGSRPPSFPIQRDGDLSVSSGRAGITTPELRDYELPTLAETSRLIGGQGTAGVSPAPVAAAPAGATGLAAPALPAPPIVPRPTSNDGVWIEHEGARWFASGAAVSFDPKRFEPAGAYRGFAVYRDTMGRDGTIFVAAVTDGPLVPYARR